MSVQNALKGLQGEESFIFRDFAKFCNFLLVGDLITNNKVKKGTVTYTEKSAEFFQTSLFTNDIKILFPLIQNSFKIKIPSDNVGSESTSLKGSLQFIKILYLSRKHSLRNFRNVLYSRI